MKLNFKPVHQEKPVRNIKLVLSNVLELYQISCEALLT